MGRALIDRSIAGEISRMSDVLLTRSGFAASLATVESGRSLR